MSRIDQALRRALDVKEAEARVDPHALDEYRCEGAPKDDVPVLSAAAPSPTRPVVPSVKPALSTVRTFAHSAIAAGSAFDVVAEPAPQYRRLAGVLRERRLQNNANVLFVTCADATAEKPAATLALAVALTKADGGRTLVVDSNVRPPFLHELVGSSPAGGWSDALQDERRQLDVTTLSPLLHVLPVGLHPSVVAAGISLPAARQLLQQCSRLYDWVLVDAPPVSFLPVPHVLSRQGDGIVFAIGRATPFPAVERALSSLGREHVVGTIMIGFDDAHPSLHP